MNNGITYLSTGAGFLPSTVRIQKKAWEFPVKNFGLSPAFQIHNLPFIGHHSNDTLVPIQFKGFLRAEKWLGNDDQLPRRIVGIIKMGVSKDTSSCRNIIPWKRHNDHCNSFVIFLTFGMVMRESFKCLSDLQRLGMKKVTAWITWHPHHWEIEIRFFWF